MVASTDTPGLSCSVRAAVSSESLAGSSVHHVPTASDPVDGIRARLPHDDLQLAAKDVEHGPDAFLAEPGETGPYLTRRGGAGIIIEDTMILSSP